MNEHHSYGDGNGNNHDSGNSAHHAESAPVARLNAFLATDPRDVGCAQAMDLLHVYVDVVADGRSREPVAGVVAHLRACGPCSDEFEGLLAAVSDGWGAAGLAGR